MKINRIFAASLSVFVVCLSLHAGEIKSGQKALPPKDTSGMKTGFELSPIVDFDAFMELAKKVQVYRRSRLVSLDTFLRWGKKPDFVILDTRSDSAFRGKHIKGAKHLDFANFTQEALAELIPDRNTNILIYCNNNFKSLQFEPAYFVSKAVRPNLKIEVPDSILSGLGMPVKQLTLALNIPTFINLYGYGYRNVYELGEQVFVTDPRLEFEGTSVSP